MSAMADLHTALEDQAAGRPLDAEQADLVRRYAAYLRSPVNNTDWKLERGDRYFEALQEIRAEITRAIVANVTSAGELAQRIEAIIDAATVQCICPAIQPHGSNPVPPTTNPDCRLHGH